MEKESCKTTGEAVSDHFVDVTKMVKIGSGAERKQDDMMQYSSVYGAKMPRTSWQFISSLKIGFQSNIETSS